VYVPLTQLVSGEYPSYGLGVCRTLKWLKPSGFVCQRRFKALEQDFDRRFALDLGSRQCFAKGPDRIRIRHCVGKPQTEKAHERQPVLDQILGSLVRQAVAGLQDRRLEHQHMIESRPIASRSLRARYRSFQIAAEQLEINEYIQPFQLIALG
jgi:hypothetical protein